jgi:hypothetical protein
MSVSSKIEAIQNLQATHSIISTLEQSKSSIEHLVDEMPDALFVFDTKGTILKANLEGCRLLRVEPEYYLGSNLSKVFDAESANIIFNKIQQVSQSPKSFERPHEFELQAITGKDESQPYHWALRPLVPLRFEKIPLIVLYGRNLIDIRSFERELSQIYSNIPLGILSVGVDGLVEANYSRYCEYLLQHSRFSGLNNGFAKIGIVELLFEPAFPTLKPAEVEACSLLVRAIGQSEYWFESVKTQFPNLLRRRVGDSELWLKVDYHAVSADGLVQKILLIIENRTDLIREREERNVWIKRNESAVRRILEIQNAESSILLGICLDLETLIRRLDHALAKDDFIAFKNGVDGVRFAADSAGFLALKEMVEILQVKITGEPGQELFKNRNHLAKEYSQIRTECVELVRIFYTLNTDDEISRDFQHKLDPTLYKDITASIDQAIQSLQPDSLASAREVLLRLRKHVLKINYLRLSTMEPFLTDLAKVQSNHDRKLVKVTFEWDSIMVPPELARPLRDIFVLLIEKSISEGIEAPNRRRKLGKAEYGHIRIKAQSDDQGILFLLADDGRGISAGKIREVLNQKAVFSDLILQKMTDEQLFQQVFGSDLLVKEGAKIGPIVDFVGLKRFFDEHKVSDIRFNSQLGLGLMLEFRLRFDTELI